MGSGREIPTDILWLLPSLVTKNPIPSFDTSDPGIRATEGPRVTKG